MKKTWIVAVFLVLGAGIFFGMNFLKTSNNLSPDEITETPIRELKPDRKPELYGKVRSLEGNLVTLTLIDLSQDPTAGMESAEKRKYMKSLSDAERMALKEKIAQSLLDDTKVVIPIGIPISVKKEQGPDAPELYGSLADIVPNKLISIWLNQTQIDKSIAEFVKINFSR